MKNTLLFICRTNILVRLLTVNMYEEQSYHKKSENVRPLVTLLKMRLHYSQSSRKNATPSSCTSTLASYQAVPPPSGGVVFQFIHLVSDCTHIVASF